jgi:hypothetical protein
MFRYAGIGSRETPEDVLHSMRFLGAALGEYGWLLRSGHAGGADMAFETGAIAAAGKMEIFLPWSGFNGAAPHDPRYIIPQFSNELMDLAASTHPAWDRCSQGAKKLHARNGCQILGSTLKTPVDLVICWTKGATGSGGTGQAIRIARSHQIPVFDLADPTQYDALVVYANKLMNQGETA